MRTIIFELPKIVHRGDSFAQELRTDKNEKWYGFNKEIQVSNDREYLKIKNNTLFTFILERISSLLIIPLSTLSETKKMLLGMINYYDLGINKQPLVINKQEKCLFELGFNLENKKYIKFKNDPVVFIHIFNILA